MRIAVVGAGISGLGAAWLLSRSHDATVYERNDYLGGHSNTVDVPFDGGTIPVDTGFIVYNERTYPNLLRLFGHLDVPVKKTDMSFAVSLDQGRLEYGGKDIWQMFAQHKNWFSPRFYGMVRDIVRFYGQAQTLLDAPSANQITLGDYLALGGYSRAFIDDHILPMGAAIWSCPAETMAAFPAKSFVRFFANHGLLEVKTENRPQWFTVDGGSREYVRRLVGALDGQVHTKRPARSVRRVAGQILVDDGSGVEQSYDHVVFGCHADEALALLADPDPEERRLLGAFRYSKNRAVLHKDVAQMPRRRRIWSSWNYLHDRSADADGSVAVTYWMNCLQSLDRRCPLFVTLNPTTPIPEERTINEFEYDHPIFDSGAVAAQSELPRIQGIRNTWFCGSYCGFGFHEDGLSSALAVARALGEVPPWGVYEHHAMRAVGGPVTPVPLAAE